MKTHLVVNQRVSSVFTHIHNQFTIIYCHDPAKTPADKHGHGETWLGFGDTHSQVDIWLLNVVMLTINCNSPKYC